MNIDVGDDPLRKQQAIRFYCNHLVSLAVSFVRINVQGDYALSPEGFAFSGFVMSVRGQWNLVTAGHIVRDLDSLFQNKKATFTGSVLIDGWGSDAVYRQGPFPPFNYLDASRTYVYDDEYGLDFALIGLPKFYQTLLEANGIKPVSERNWVLQDRIVFREHFVLGLPTELKQFTPDGQTFAPTPAIIPVTKLDGPPTGHDTQFGRFFGKIFDNVTISDIDGMSGGPIIGIGDGGDGVRRYWIVALQSGWIRDKRIIFGCPVPVFAAMVEAQIRQLENDAGLGVGHGEEDRWAWLSDLDDDLLQGGVILSDQAIVLTRNADICFASGAFVACIVMCAATVETWLRGEGDKGRFIDLVDASDFDTVTKSKMHALRRDRNRWVHVDDPWAETDLVEEYSAGDTVLEYQCKEALRLMRTVVYSNPSL